MTESLVAAFTSELMTTGPLFTMNATVDVPLHSGSNTIAVIVESSTLALIMALTILGNLVAIVTIFRVPMLRKNPHNILIMNLTVTDLGVALTSMVFSMISVFDDGRLLKTNSTLCDFNGFCTVIFSASSFATITCIAIDRYLTVVWSARFPSSHLRACVMVVSIWVFSASYAVMPLVNVLSSFAYLDGTHHCSPVWESCFFYVIGFMTNYVITIPVMFVCYLFVFRVIWKKQVPLAEYRAAGRNLPYSQQSFDETVMDSESKPGDHVFTPAPPSSALSNSSDEGKDIRTGVARVSMSVSMSHLDTLRSADDSPSDWIFPYRCTGDCRLRGYQNCPRCISIPTRQLKSCSTDTEVQREDGRSGSAMHAESKVGSSKPKSDRRRTCGIISPESGRWAHSRSFDMIDMRERKKASRKVERSGSFFSLANLRRRSSGLKGNTTTRKANKKQRKMYAKRMKKLRADKQVALTGSFLILSSLVCWLPYAITRSCFFPVVHSKHWVDITAMWISFVNAFLDPLIYAFMNRRVKAKLREDCKAAREYLRSCCGVGRQEDEIDDL